jgi:hypothetical protein
MRYFCIVIAASVGLLTAGAAHDHAGAQGVTPPPLGYEPPPYTDEYGPPSYELPPGYG